MVVNVCRHVNVWWYTRKFDYNFKNCPKGLWPNLNYISVGVQCMRLTKSDRQSHKDRCIYLYVWEQELMATVDNDIWENLNLVARVAIQ